MHITFHRKWYCHTGARVIPAHVVSANTEALPSNGRAGVQVWIANSRMIFERTNRECLLRYLLQQNARLVNRMNPLTNIFVSYCDGMVMVMGFRSSELFGQCNSCDGKLKGCNSCVDQQSVASWTFQKPETLTFFKIIDKA